MNRIYENLMDLSKKRTTSSHGIVEEEKNCTSDVVACPLYDVIFLPEDD